MSQADPFFEVDEDVRREQWLQRWRKYGPAVIPTCLAIVIGTAAGVWLRERDLAAAQLQSDRLSQLTLGDAAPPSDPLIELARAASGNHGALALLHAARQPAAGGAGARGQAATIYRSVAAAESADGLLRDFARLQAAQLDPALDNPGAEVTALLSTLGPMTAEGGPWRLTSREVAAALALKAGDRAGALERLAALADDPAAPESLSARARRLHRQLESEAAR